MTEDQKRLRPFRESAVDEGSQAMFLALKWSPPQREMFKKLWVSRLEKGDRLLGRLDARDPLTAQVMQEQLTNEFLAELQSAIGAQAVQEYQYYNNTERARNLAAELASQFLFSDSPITAEQANKLVAIIVANASNPSGQVEWKYANVGTILGRAHEALSAPQVEQLSKLLAKRIAPQDQAQTSRFGFYVGS